MFVRQCVEESKRIYRSEIVTPRNGFKLTVDTQEELVLRLDYFSRSISRRLSFKTLWNSNDYTTLIRHELLEMVSEIERSVSR